MIRHLGTKITSVVIFAGFLLAGSPAQSDDHQNSEINDMSNGTIDAGLNKKIIYEANQWCDGIIVGGGNLYENYELFLDFNALESLQIPLLLFSISLGKIYAKGISLSR